jgi:hypothetical protein
MDPVEIDPASRVSRIPIAIRKRVSVVGLLVVLNYLVFFIGAYLNTYGGAIDAFGADLSEATYVIGSILIPASILYAPIRRFVLPTRQWDLYGPGLAIILNLVMYVILFRQPWYLPEWPWW